jgi:hypothetical protein
VKLLRGIGLALLLSLLFGLAVGTLLRRRAEQPVRYIGLAPSGRSAPSAFPLHVAAVSPGVLQPGEHEEQVG